MTTLEKLEELIYKGFKETDERIAQQRKELNDELVQHRKEIDESAAQHRKESDERIEKLWQETKDQWKATDKRMERMHRQFSTELNGVTDSLSRFSEQTVFPATIKLFNKRGIKLNRLYGNMQEHLNGDNMETDVIGLGPECAVLIEVKLRLRQEDVEEFLEKKLPRFFDFFPSFRRPVLYGGVAGMSIDSGVGRFAYKRGLFVIAQNGDNVRLLNDKKFKPRSFSTPEDNRFPQRKSIAQRTKRRA